MVWSQSLWLRRSKNWFDKSFSSIRNELLCTVLTTSDYLCFNQCVLYPHELVYRLVMVTSLRSKWAVGKARGGRISESIRNRRATRPPAHFQRNPPGRGQLAVFRVARSTRMTQIWALRSRLEKQPTDLRRRHHYLRDGTLGTQRRQEQPRTTCYYESRSTTQLRHRSCQPGIRQNGGGARTPTRE